MAEIETDLAEHAQPKPQPVDVRAGWAKDNHALDEFGVERRHQQSDQCTHRVTNQHHFVVAVPLQTGGKRAKRIALGDAMIAAGAAELTQAIAEVQSDVRRAYFSRATAESRLTLLQDMQQLAQRARDAAQARFDTGDARKSTAHCSG